MLKIAIVYDMLDALTNVNHNTGAESDRRIFSNMWIVEVFLCQPNF